MRPRKYTTETAQAVCSAYRKGQPVTKIAAETGVSVSAVYVMLREGKATRKAKKGKDAA